MLIVASINETEIPLLKKTIDTLKGLNAKILGSVINKVPTTRNSYYKYGYDYGYQYTTSLVTSKDNKPLVKKIKNKAVRIADIAISTLALPLLGILMLISKINKVDNIFVKDTIKTRHGHKKQALKFNTKEEKNKFTSFLEKTNLDNLPHILNYLKGDLSFIKK